MTRDDDDDTISKPIVIADDEIEAANKELVARIIREEAAGAHPRKLSRRELDALGAPADFDDGDALGIPIDDTVAPRRGRSGSVIIVAGRGFTDDEVAAALSNMFH